MNDCLLFSILRSIIASQKQRHRCIFFSVSWWSGGIKSRLCPEWRAEWKPLALHCTGPGTQLILDLHVDQIICIPLQRLFQQSQWVVYQYWGPLESCGVCYHIQIMAACKVGIWSGQSKVVGAELVLESSVSSSLQISQIVFLHYHSLLF